MGMEATLKNSVFIAIFVVCIITFSVSFAIDNESDISLASNTEYTDLATQLTGDDLDEFQENAETSQSILESTSISSGDSEISGSGGQFKVGPYTALKMTTRSFTTAFDTILGEDFNFILVLFTGLFVFLVGYYIIKAWLGRDPS